MGTFLQVAIFFFLHNNKKELVLQTIKKQVCGCKKFAQQFKLKTVCVCANLILMLHFSLSRSLSLLSTSLSVIVKSFHYTLARKSGIVLGVLIHEKS